MMAWECVCRKWLSERIKRIERGVDSAWPQEIRLDEDSKSQAGRKCKKRSSLSKMALGRHSVAVYKITALLIITGAVLGR